MFIDVNLLEHRKLRFDEWFPAGLLQFPDEWKQKAAIHAEGEAELLDRAGSRTIRVRGLIQGRAEAGCARCLEPFEQDLDGPFELFYYPMTLIARAEQIPIDRHDAESGFYEGHGVELADVIREQVLLSLPMRGLCREDCRGICPRCGVNRNQRACDCAEDFTDPRWDALKKLSLKTKN
jgi:uncharacterized protein